MIGQNTIKGRKTRSKVAELNEEIRRLKADIAILQEDKEKFRSRYDNLASKTRKLEDPAIFLDAALSKEKAKFESVRKDLIEHLDQARRTLEGLKVANSRLKDTILYATLAGIIAGLLLAPYITSL